MNPMTRWLTLAALIATTVAPMMAQEADNREPGVALTVYNGGFGVVREVRQLAIGEDGVVKFTDVAKRIDPTTVHFKSLTDRQAQLLEQNYQYDLVSADKLLQKYIDRPIEVVAENNLYRGKLLSYDGGQLVLQSDDGGVVMVQRPDNVTDIRFSALPGGLLTQPTLVWLVHTDNPGRHLSEVTYQTSGIQWHAEYVMVLGGDDTSADLSGWVSVNNQSGKTYRDAKLKFIAGDVRKIQQPRPNRTSRGARPMAAAESTPMQEKAFFEYHMYTLPRPSTVADRETKQLEMFEPARGLKVEKRYLYSPLRGFRWSGSGRYTNRGYGVTSDKKVNVFIEFKNEEENQLGIPLPAGKIRLYKQDPDDQALEFIGEEQIDHTPKDEELSLMIGNAFDIVGERKQTDFKVRSNQDWMQETVEIEIRNHKDEAVTVRCKEPMYRWRNWRIVEKSHDFEKLDSRTIAFDVDVPADGKVKVRYVVEYTW